MIGGGHLDGSIRSDASAVGPSGVSCEKDAYQPQDEKKYPE
jgi:hypothetical protein